MVDGSVAHRAELGGAPVAGIKLGSDRLLSAVDSEKIFNDNKLNKLNTRKKEKGCTEPLYGKKAKCVIKIIPQEEKCKSITIDKKCLKYTRKK